jgi:hypothetical protein
LKLGVEEVVVALVGEELVVLIDIQHLRVAVVLMFSVYF